MVRVGGKDAAISPPAELIGYSKMKLIHTRELATSPLFLMSLVMLLAVFDAVSSVWMINYTDVLVREGTLMIVDEQGLIDITKVSLLTAAKCAAYGIGAMLYKNGRKPNKACYTSLRRVYKEHRVFMLGFAVLYVSIYVNIFIALINNPYNFIRAAMGLRGIPEDTFLVLCAIFTLSLYYYTQYSLLWRYLTDEAKAKYPYLAWPYTKGLMNKDNLSLT